MAENMREKEDLERAALQKAKTGKKHSIVFTKHHLPYNPGDTAGWHDPEVAKRFVDQGFAQWDSRFHEPSGAFKVEGVLEVSKTVKK